MILRRFYLLNLVLWLTASLALAQGNGKLQVHHMDVGQGDGAVLVSPGGQVVLFDAGEDMKRKDCTAPLSYLDQLGVKQIDFLFVSHYHFDHIGCIPAVLQEFQLKGDAYDRGESYPGKTYGNYIKAVKGHRKTAGIGDKITLDKNSANPVVITVVAVDRKSESGQVHTSNENDLSLAVVISFGSFREEIGGDLSGDNAGMYKDVETPVAPDVGQIDVYKVHHHCSSHSTNDAWLAATKPTVGIISTGDGNPYGHPAADCLERLHTQGLERVYWTERGNGQPPEEGLDVVGGNIVVQVAPGANTYTVSFGGPAPDTYQTVASAGTSTPVNPAAGPKKYAWSTKSQIYHLADCAYVANISRENLREGDEPPPGKTRHKGCPK